MDTLPALTFLSEQEHARHLRNRLVVYLILLFTPLMASWTSPEWTVAHFFEISMFSFLILLLCANHFFARLSLVQSQFETLNKSLKELGSAEFTTQFQDAFRQQRIITYNHLRMVQRALDTARAERTRQSILQIEHDQKVN